MLAEFLNSLEETTSKRLTPLVIPELSGPNVTTLAINGELIKTNNPDRVRSYQFDTIASLVEGLNFFASAEFSVCLVQPLLIRCQIDPDNRSPECDELIMPLDLNPVFDVLESLAKKWLTQKEAVNVSRHDLSCCDIGPEHLKAILRKLRFATNVTSNGEFTNTSVSLGKSLESQFTGEVELPETFSVEFHPYPQLADDFPRLGVVVMCSLFTDAEKGLLKFSPLPGELQRCKQEAASAIATHLTDAGFNVFLGSVAW